MEPKWLALISPFSTHFLFNFGRIIPKQARNQRLGILCMAHCPHTGSKFRPAIAAPRIARELLCLMISPLKISHTGAKTGVKAFALLLSLFIVSPLAMAQSSENKGSNPSESSRQNNGVGIDSVIDQNNDNDAWKLLEQGFVIECSGRFESGCRLFLKTD